MIFFLHTVFYSLQSEIRSSYQDKLELEYLYNNYNVNFVDEENKKQTFLANHIEYLHEISVYHEQNNSSKQKEIENGLNKLSTQELQLVYKVIDSEFAEKNDSYYLLITELSKSIKSLKYILEFRKVVYNENTYGSFMFVNVKQSLTMLNIKRKKINERCNSLKTKKIACINRIVEILISLQINPEKIKFYLGIFSFIEKVLENIIDTENIKITFAPLYFLEYYESYGKKLYLIIKNIPLLKIFKFTRECIYDEIDISEEDMKSIQNVLKSFQLKVIEFHKKINVLFSLLEEIINELRELIKQSYQLNLRQRLNLNYI
ncbi:uncharacterized protein VNE69_03372 [Vairimorpha necatrix]|uniref:Uncharacterized protein n=1 Tax=Vairimorpha necatrix TaxID=6039 RepID=A0AAX4JBC4_9MICR